jgi:hypothetical protein
MRVHENTAQADLGQGFTVRILSGTRTFAEQRRNDLNQYGDEQADSASITKNPMTVQDGRVSCEIDHWRAG